MTQDDAVLVCRGKSCCEQEACSYANLCELLDAAGVLVKTVKCVGVCDGPTAGVCVDGRVEWFKKLTKKKSQKDLVAVAVGAEPSTHLAKRQLKGSSRKKATRKAHKYLS